MGSQKKDTRFKQGNKVGNRFTSENQPHVRGRKPKVYKELKRLVGQQIGHELEEQDFKNIMQALLELPYGTVDDLSHASGDTKKLRRDIPAWVQILVRNIVVSAKRGKIDALEYAMNRLFGGATQKIEGEVTTTHQVKDLSMLSTEELLQYNTLLEKIEKGGVK